MPATGVYQKVEWSYKELPKVIALALATMKPPAAHTTAATAPTAAGAAALLPARWVCDPPQSINGELLRCRPAHAGKRQKRI